MANADGARGALVVAFAPASIGGGVAKRPLSRRSWRARRQGGGGRLHGGEGGVERPRGGEVRVVSDPFRCRNALGERGAATGIAPVVPRLLSRPLSFSYTMTLEPKAPS